MKHPQPGVGCGPCDWAVEGYSLDNCPHPALHLLGHATTHQTPNTLNLNNISSNNKIVGARRDTKLERVADRHSSQTEAVRRYRAAFPALRGDAAAAEGAMAAPAWCRERRAAPREAQREEAPARPRRNSYHGQRRGASAKRRCRSFGKPAARAEEAPPEWLEAADDCDWDMETQDPVREFVRALALDEGRSPPADDAFRPLECRKLESRQREAAEADRSLARFRAKFHRGLEALWGPPEAPSFKQDALAEPYLATLPPSPGNIWSYEAPLEEPSREEAALALECVARSLEALNHDRRLSSFREVAPGWGGGGAGGGTARRPPPAAAEGGSPLRFATHFRPIRPEAAGYADGATFPPEGPAPGLRFARSGSGAMLLHSAAEPPRRYMEYRSPDTDHPDHPDHPDRFVLKFQVRQIEKAVQTEGSEEEAEGPGRRLDAELLSRIWGSGDPAAAAAAATARAKAADDDSDWEELLSDIGWRRAPSPIAKDEPSFSAPDGDFASALRAAAAQPLPRPLTR